MGNVLEFYLKMKDMMSSGLVTVAKNAKAAFTNVQDVVKKVESAVSSSTDKMVSKFTGFEYAGKRMNFSLATMKENLKQLQFVKANTDIRKEFDAATKAITALNYEIDKLEGKKKGSGKASGGMGLGKIAATIGLGLSLSGAFGFAKESVGAAMQFDAQKKSFGVMTGNRGTGNDLANNLRQLKQDAIMGPTVYENAQTMLGFGINVKKIMPDLKMLGDVSMGDADNLKSLTLAFSQVSAAGKLTGQDLLQFINAGFNPLQEISKNTGKSFAVLKKEMQAGKITFAMVEDAFKTATSAGGRFNGMLDTMADTTMGKMKKMEGQWAAFKIDIGEALMPLAGELMTAGNEMLSFLNIHKSVPTVLGLEQSSINVLVNKITSLNLFNKTRIELLEKLKNSYPDLFGKINTEVIANEELLKILEKINGAYENKIKLASNSISLEKSIKGQNNNYRVADSMLIAIDRLKHGDKEGASSALGDVGRILIPFASVDKNIDFLTKEADRLQKQGDAWQPNIDYDKNEKRRLEGDKMLSDNNGLMQQADKWIAAHKKPFVRGQKDLNLELINKVHAKASEGAATDKDFNALREMMGMKKLAPSAIKEKMGVDIESDGSGSGKTKRASKVNSEAIGSSITGGGPRVINIHGVKFCDKVELHAATVKESASELENVFNDMFLRVLNSGASVQ
jgi:tape measure domain-containing protein